MLCNRPVWRRCHTAIVLPRVRAHRHKEAQQGGHIYDIRPSGAMQLARFSVCPPADG